MYLSLFLPLNCDIRQLVDLFSFLIRKLAVFKDYSASNHRKLDMETFKSINVLAPGYTIQHCSMDICDSSLMLPKSSTTKQVN